MRRGVTVVCELSTGASFENNARTCAERRAIEALKHTAARKGVGGHRLFRFLWRLLDRCNIRRHQRSGALSISFPCVCCRRELDRLRVRWTAYDRLGQPVCDEDAPPAVKTSRQRKYM
jgi:hypothetical protein